MQRGARAAAHVRVCVPLCGGFASPVAEAGCEFTFINFLVHRPSALSGAGPAVFRDKYCFNVGADWDTGFLRALNSEPVVCILASSNLARESSIVQPPSTIILQSRTALGRGVVE